MSILWSIFGNNDDWPPPTWYYEKHTRPWWPDWFSKAVWLFWRNPLHNLMTYTLGLKGKEYTSTGKYPEHNYLPEGGWNYAFRWYKGVPLPFVSYVQYGDKWTFRFNTGWRDNGALNILSLQLKRRKNA